jgi:hypothetical protein
MQSRLQKCSPARLKERGHGRGVVNTIRISLESSLKHGILAYHLGSQTIESFSRLPSIYTEGIMKAFEMDLTYYTNASNASNASSKRLAI